MSVTFRTSAPSVYTITCSDGVDRHPTRYRTWQAAEAALGEHYNTCRHERCVQWRTASVMPVDTSPTLNVCEANAAVLLEALGFTTPEDRYLGSCDAVDFHGRVLVAVALTPTDAGTPAVSVGERWTEMGRPTGYTQQRLRILGEIAEWATLHGELVEWA